MEEDKPFLHFSPNVVKFGQSSISHKFTEGDSVAARGDRTDAVVNVVKYKGELYAENNRTLYNQKVCGNRCVVGV